MRRYGLLLGTFCYMLTLLFFMFSGIAQANSGPALSQKLAVGPYIVQVDLAQYPPVTDQAVQVTVVPQDSNVRLSGQLRMLPGLGTDAVALHAQLSPASTGNTLTGFIRMPVRGAWLIAVQLTGPQGTDETSFPITVAAPGSIPIWLGWLIGSTPLLSIAFIVWHQRRYRKKLLLQSAS